MARVRAVTEMRGLERAPHIPVEDYVEEGTYALRAKMPGIDPDKVGDVVPLKDQAIINPVPNGYLVRAGQQDSDMTMEVVDGRLQVIDTGTLEWKWLPSECRELDVPGRGRPAA